MNPGFVTVHVIVDGWKGGADLTRADGQLLANCSRLKLLTQIFTICVDSEWICRQGRGHNPNSHSILEGSLAWLVQVARQSGCFLQYDNSTA